MRRLALLLCSLAAFPSFGLTRTVAGGRIGVLRPALFSRSGENAVAKAIHGDLCRELRARGFDAFDARATLAELQRGVGVPADWYVEIASSDADGTHVADMGTTIGPFGLDVGLVLSRVVAEFRVYDARTLEVVARYDLRNSSTAVVPTGIGVATRPFWAFFALPFVQYGEYRSAAHAVARQAAEAIARR